MLAKLISDLQAGAPSRTTEIPANIAGVTCKLTVEQLLQLATPADSASAPAVHGLLAHVAAGLTSGHVLVATGATTFEFRKLTDFHLPNPAGIDVTGNAGTASRLLNPRQIAGVNFDGTADVAIAHGDLSEAGERSHAEIDAHLDDADKHRVINDAGTLGTDLWSAAQIIGGLATRASASHNHAGTYEPANANIQSHIADAAKHRTINDAGTLATDLWSAARIIAQLATKAASGHLHAGTYEPANANIQSHIGDATKHRVINDAGSLSTDLWSAAQILAELATKAAASHNHALAGLAERAYGSLTGRPSFFAVIAVAGQSNVAADAEGDTLTLVAGAGIVITTDPATDAVTITNIGGGTPGPHGHTGPADGGAFDALAVGGNPVWHAGNDGSGSGLDADTVDGMQPSSANVVSSLVSRDASGDFAGRYVTVVYLNLTHAAAARTTDTVFFSSNDTYLRKNTKAGMLASLGLANAWTAENDGSGSGLDADTVDGLHAADLGSPALRIVMAQQFGGF
ncbi:hypothetical protein [Solidesulfovibrio sp.]